jgi:hypothetical protein
MAPNIQGLTLTAPDGRELRTLAWFPTDEVRQDFYEKARKRGQEIINDHELNELNELEHGKK